jgi:hypothetical protein
MTSKKVLSALGNYEVAVRRRVDAEARVESITIESKVCEAHLREAREQERKMLALLEQAVEDGE